MRSAGRSNGMGAVPRIARQAAAAALAAAAAAVLLLAGLIVSGRLTIVITHGVSMQPLYHQGDLIVVAAAPSYSVGQIVAYRIPSRHMIVLHRLISEHHSQLAFKGDNNQSVDPWHPNPRQVVGRAIVHIPQGGLWLERATSPPAVAVAAALLLGSGGAAGYGRRRRRRRMPTHARTVRRPTGVVGASSPRRRGLVAALASAAIAGVALAGLAWTSPRTQVATVTTQQPRRMDFSYRARVRPSAAYTGTVVRSPDPVFRRLADTVEVHYRYAGPPGSVTVVAQLSASSGWHTRIPLTAETNANGTVGTVTLDLPALAATAAAAEAATGVPTTPLSVAVVPTVTTATGKPFAPAVGFTLTAAELSLADGARSLTVLDSVPVTGQERRPRVFSLAGHTVSDAALRAIAVTVLALALAASAIAAVAERRLRRASLVDAVRRRYDVPVVEIAPLTAQLERPAVEVRTVADLIELATRLALPVLHWTEPGVDSFAVHDEFVVYRAAVTTSLASGLSGKCTALSGFDNGRRPHADAAYSHADQ
jgi:signal peptidase I